ncbi:hypothetical protein DXC40_16035 [Anaerotruncus colihominis]|uniref:Uncharacterized protein n=1 Tax=Anaerotruncus colihominis TaxID=169435 RepID=A0A3E3IFB1_9FIRM|nr:hypothetical protein DXC40_16035 [Anaerotruncus colihominis]
MKKASAKNFNRLCRKQWGRPCVISFAPRTVGLALRKNRPRHNKEPEAKKEAAAQTRGGSGYLQLVFFSATYGQKLDEKGGRGQRH